MSEQQTNSYDSRPVTSKRLERPPFKLCFSRSQQIGRSDACVSKANGIHPYHTYVVRISEPPALSPSRPDRRDREIREGTSGGFETLRLSSCRETEKRNENLFR